MVLSTLLVIFSLHGILYFSPAAAVHGFRRGRGAATMGLFMLFFEGLFMDLVLLWRVRPMRERAASGRIHVGSSTERFPIHEYWYRFFLGTFDSSSRSSLAVVSSKNKQ